MKYPCVFKCQSEGGIYKIFEISTPSAPYGYYYHLYHGRRRVKDGVFTTMMGACRYATELATRDWCHD